MAEIELIPQSELDRIQKAIDTLRELKSLQPDPDVALRERCVKMVFDVRTGCASSGKWPTHRLEPIYEAELLFEFIKTGPNHATNSTASTCVSDTLDTQREP